MEKYKLIWALPIFVLLNACASLSKDECITADWHLIGYEDGASGKNVSRIGEHRQACAKHGITPDLAAYEQGHSEGILVFCSRGRGLSFGQSGSTALAVCPNNSDFHAGYAQGLVSYCTYDSGYQHGLAGHAYNQVCTNEAEQNFLDGYDTGKHIFNLETSYHNLGDELEAVVADQEANQKNIEDTKGQITYDESLTKDQRRRLLDKLEDYNKLTVELAAKHVAIEVEMEEIRRELEGLGRR